MIDEPAEIQAFLQGFVENATIYIEAHRRVFGEDNIAEVLTWIHGYYRMILLGDVEGRDKPVSVSVV